MINSDFTYEHYYASEYINKRYYTYVDDGRIPSRHIIIKLCACGYLSHKVLESKSVVSYLVLDSLDNFTKIKQYLDGDVEPQNEPTKLFIFKRLANKIIEEKFNDDSEIFQFVDSKTGRLDIADVFPISEWILVGIEHEGKRIKLESRYINKLIKHIRATARLHMNKHRKHANFIPGSKVVKKILIS